MTNGNLIPTPRQREVLSLIEAFIRLRGYPPTRRELQAQMGAKSSCSAALAVDRLVRKGLVARPAAQWGHSPSRAMAVTAEGYVALGQYAQCLLCGTVVITPGVEVRLWQCPRCLTLPVQD